MKKKYFKIISIIIIIILAFIVFSLEGNPLSKYLAERSADKYIGEEYRELDLKRDNIYYDFKRGNIYTAEYYLENSIDTNFTVDIDMLGNIMRDDYKLVVDSGFNTISRLDLEFNDIINKIVKKELDYNTDIIIGGLLYDTEYPLKDIKGLFMDMELDLDMDIEKYISVYIIDEELSWKNVAKISKELYSIMEENNIKIDYFTIVIEELNDEGITKDSIGIYDFPKEKFKEDDLENEMEDFFEKWNKN